MDGLIDGESGLGQRYPLTERPGYYPMWRHDKTEGYLAPKSPEDDDDVPCPSI
jgi:hypothetical protein